MSNQLKFNVNTIDTHTERLQEISRTVENNSNVSISELLELENESELLSNGIMKFVDEILSTRDGNENIN